MLRKVSIGYVKCELCAEDGCRYIAKNHVHVVSRESGGPLREGGM